MLADLSRPLAPTWLPWVLFGVVVVFAAVFLFWVVVSLVDDLLRSKARDRFFDTLNVAFTRGLLSVERAKNLSRAHHLKRDDLRRVLLRLVKAACLGQIERKEAEDVRELEALLKEVEEEDPFQAMPSELKGPLLRIASALQDKSAMEPLIGHLRDFTTAGRRQKKYAHILAVAGVALSAGGIVLAIWFRPS
jgi:hypothetical protein